MNFRFDEATHRYFRGDIEVPGVTRCLDHAGLVNYDAIRKEILERKSALGKVVHLATQFYDENVLDWKSLDEQTKPYVDGWAEFRAITGFVPDVIECQSVVEYSGMPYGMQLDRMGKFGKDEAVIELKISSQKCWWWGIQLAGYALGAEDRGAIQLPPMARFKRRRRMAVQLLPTGKLKFKKHDFDKPRDADVFVATLVVTHRKLEEGVKIRELEQAA